MSLENFLPQLFIFFFNSFPPFPVPNLLDIPEKTLSSHHSSLQTCLICFIFFFSLQSHLQSEAIAACALALILFCPLRHLVILVSSPSMSLSLTFAHLYLNVLWSLFLKHTHTHTHSLLTPHPYLRA